MKRIETFLLNHKVNLAINFSMAFILLYFFYYQNYIFLFRDFKITTMLLVVKQTMDILFFLIRIKPQKISITLLSIIATFLGSFLPFFFVSTYSNFFSNTSIIIMCLGILFEIISLRYLNKSYGLLPALREIKTSGPYKVIRHPLYLSYFITKSAFVLNNFSMNNIFVLVLFILMELLRAYLEEEILLEDPDLKYARYCEQVKWKIIPLIY